jgi:hypothetical protein
MTRSKIEFATILATMRGQGEDPAKLAQEMTLRKLCYEIEKIEQAAEEASKVPEEPKEETSKKSKGPRPFWSWLLADSDDEDS